MSSGLELESPVPASVSTAPVSSTIHIVERMAPGGIETLVLDAACASWDGHPHLLMSLQGEVSELTEAWPRLRSLPLQIEAFGRRPGVDARLVIRLARRIAAIQPSAVFVHHMGPLLYGGLAARIAGVRRLIHVEHDAWHYDGPREAALARWCGRILRPRLVAVSQQVATRLARVMPGRPITVIPPGIPTERFRPREKLAARRSLSLDPTWRIIGTAGRLVQVKGLPYLLDALKQLPSEVHVVIVGDGPDRDELHRRADQLGLADRVHFLGHRDNLEDIYPAFDVFAQPSLHEGLPRCILEAQACGIPVVATSVGGIPEAVDSASGELVPPRDPAALGQAILRILQDPGPRVSPRGFIESNLSLTRTLRGYAELAEH
jgi:glycosyltransferase involved in cell wall biosynthesis